MIRLTHCAILLSLFLAACGEEKITVYTAPKEETPAPQIEAPGTGSGSGITWTAPKAWKEQSPSEMRQGSFLVAGENGTKVDISVAGFPGDVGGDLANVNRWRGQINLPELDETGLRDALQKIDMNGAPALLVEMVEKTDGSGRKIIAAILHREDRTWFFKMMGDASLVTAQKKDFLEFLSTIRFSGAQADASAPAPAMGVPQLATAPVETSQKPKWKLPSGWEEQPASGMRLGSFSINEGGSKVDISLVVLSGNAGGLLANVNRWCGQLLLPDMTATELAAAVTNVKAGENSAAIVDIAGETPAAGSKSRSRILGAIIERDERTWFIKATGEESLVEKHKSEFIDFVKSLQLPGHD